MKYIKIKIKKIRIDNNSKTNFIYPDGYDKDKINIIYYQNEGLEFEYAIGITEYDFSNISGINEISIGDAKKFINDYIIRDKDIKEEKLQSQGITREKFILSRQNMLGK